MGLKDLKSKLDLVNGNEIPVGNMEKQMGPQFQLPIETADQKHKDSLTQQSNYQYGDSKAKQGPSTLDLNGNPDLNYNTLNGTLNSPFTSKTGTSDHMIDLLTQNVRSNNHPYTPHNGTITYSPSPNKSDFQDLNGLPGKAFQLPLEAADQKHKDSLTQQSNYQHGGFKETVGPSTQDLDGNPGPMFHGGVRIGSGVDTLHVDLLSERYKSNINPGASYGAGQPGGTWPSVRDGGLDLDGGLPTNGEYLNNFPS